MRDETKEGKLNADHYGLLVKMQGFEPATDKKINEISKKRNTLVWCSTLEF